MSELPIIGVTGSRSLNSEADRINCWRFMDQARERFGPFRVAHGCCKKGWDRFVSAWCKERGVPEVPFPPKVGFGCTHAEYARACLARDEEIARVSTRIVAGWDGVSRGTLHTMKAAKRLGKPVHDVLAKSQGRERWSPELAED